MIGMIKTARNAKSDISDYYSSRKQEYENSFGNYTRYIRGDMLVHFGMILGTLSVLFLFSGLIQLISLNTLPTSITMITVGIIGVKYNQKFIVRGFEQMF